MKKCFTLLAWLLLAVVFLLPACQPTPEQEAVIDKNDFEDSIVEKSPEVTEVEEPAPESIHWDEDFTNANGNITFAVDAEIQLAARYPVLEERPIDLNEEYMMEKIEALVGENPQLFTVDTRKTKAQIQDEIVQYKAEIEQIRQTVQEGNTNEMLQEELDQSDERLAELEQQYAEAPETLEEEPLAALAFETDDEGRTDLHVKAVGSRGTGIFDASTFECWRGWSYTTNLTDSVYANPDRAKDEAYLAEISMPRETAEKRAEELLERIGAEDMALTEVVAGLVDDKHLLQGTSEDEEKMEKCYCFKYRKTYNEIHTLDVETVRSETVIEGSLDTAEEETEYRYPWEDEQLFIYIGEDFETVDWYYIGEVTETVSEDTELISVEKMQELFQQDMQYKLFALDSEEMLLFVDTVTLGMTRIPKQDDYESYYVVPAWAFFNNQSLIDKGTSYLVLNAVDGSIIE